MSKNYRLPQGNYNLPLEYYSNDWEESTESEISKEKSLTKRCECGSIITIGHDIPADMHSDWCPMWSKDDHS